MQNDKYWVLSFVCTSKLLSLGGMCYNLNSHRGKLLMEQGKGENYPRKGKWNIVLPWDNEETKIGRLNSEEDGWQGEGLTPEKQLTLNQGF